MMQMRITSKTAVVCHGGISLLDIQRQSDELWLHMTRIPQICALGMVSQAAEPMA
jgi:hypothetical protein